MPPKFGLLVPQGWQLDLLDIADPEDKYEAMVAVAQEAERLGFESIWLYDHFHTLPTPELETTFECWTSLAALARDTSRIRIGPLVSSNNYRNPALLAEMASTVDVLSHGRLDLGIGAGWYEPEFRAYGYDFPSDRERLERLSEAIQLIKAMWCQDYATYEGKYYRVSGAINEPKGVQKPHIPIWVGGGGERVTLKIAAQHGDACNLSGSDIEVYRRKLAALRGHCEAVGRDYGSIIKSAQVFATLLLPGQDAEEVTRVARAQLGKQVNRDIELDEYRRYMFVGDARETRELFARLIEEGIDHIIVYLRDAVKLEMVRHLAQEVISPLRE